MDVWMFDIIVSKPNNALVYRNATLVHTHNTNEYEWMRHNEAKKRANSQLQESDGIVAT